MSFSVSEPFKATKIWNELVDHLKSSLEPRKRRWKLQSFENCFRGNELVEQLQNYINNHPELASDPSKVQVKSLAQKLLESQVIESVDGKREVFDQGNRLYRFTSSKHLQSVIELTTKGSHKAEKKKKRLSLDRWNVHRRSTKQKSMGTSSKENVIANELSQLSAQESDMKTVSNNNNEFSRKRRASFSGTNGLKDSLPETPRKFRRRSLMHTNNRTTHKSKLLSKIEEYDISPSFCKDTWFEVILSSLLKLLDVSFLDDILDSTEPEAAAEFTEITNSPYKRLVESFNNVNRSVSNEQEGGRRGRDFVWKNAAVSCFDALREFPLEHNKEFQFHNKVAITEAGISNSLAKFYSSLTDSIIPGKLSALLEGIFCLLSTRKRNVPQALRLLFNLIDQHRQEHLKRLLNFFEKSLISQARISKEQRRKYLCRVFVEGILPTSVLQDNKTEKLLNIMMDEHERLFHIPTSIKSEVKRHILSLQQGYNAPVLSVSSCHRVSVAEYDQQKDCMTRQSLLELMNAIMDDLDLSIKMKEHRLKDFQKHHLDVFCLQFPCGKF